MLLSALVFLPLFFVSLVIVAPEKMTREVTLVSSLVIFAFSLLLFKHFDPDSAALQLVEKKPWLEDLGIFYFIGIDGISFWLVLLTTFLTPMVILASWSGVRKQIKAFHVCLLILESTMIGSFLAFDAILFYVFFEISLIPMYFLIGIWGGENRIYATLKFFIYTMVGSLLMFIAIVYLIFQCGEQMDGLSASLLDFYRLEFPFWEHNLINSQNVLFFLFCLGFAIKIPVFPFHTWLPDAHVQASTGGSMILAGVMLKMGAYGFLRFVLPLFPQAVTYWTPLFMILGIVGIVYGALVAMAQVDIKKLVAYSSVSHMGYVVCGLFAMNMYGLQGSLFQMLAHGISTGALFMLVGIVYERTHSRKITEYGGLAKTLPVYSVCFFIILFSSIAVPMTNGFVGEFLILLGIFQKAPIYCFFGVFGVILGAVYMLWMAKRVFFGEQAERLKQQNTKDMNFREILTTSFFVLLVFWMGLFPGTFLKYSEKSVENLIVNREKYRIPLHGFKIQPVSKTGEVHEF